MVVVCVLNLKPSLGLLKGTSLIFLGPWALFSRKEGFAFLWLFSQPIVDGPTELGPLLLGTSAYISLNKHCRVSRTGTAVPGADTVPDLF
jgi:hypothetical protein